MPVRVGQQRPHYRPTEKIGQGGIRDGGSTTHRIFDPVGPLGRIDWYGIHPPHVWVFRAGVRAIVAEAER